MAQPQLTKKISLTEEQKQVLIGALLGDGCLYLPPKGKNAQFIYTSKSRQHVEYIEQYFAGDVWTNTTTLTPTLRAS